MSGKTNVLSVRPGRLHTLVRPLSCGYVRAEPLDKAPMELLTSPGSDDLSALLGRINVRSVVYCLSDLSAPWGFRVDGSATAKFHLVLDGQATLTLDDPGATAVTLAAGGPVTGGKIRASVHGLPRRPQAARRSHPPDRPGDAGR